MSLAEENRSGCTRDSDCGLRLHYRVMDLNEVIVMRKPTKKNGFTLVEIMIVVSIIAMLLAIATPSFVKTRDVARQNSCLSNLKAVDSAKMQWAMEFRKSDGDAVVWANIAPTYMRVRLLL